MRLEEASAAVGLSSRPALRNSKTEQMLALTGLRFFLALWVLIHHLAGKGMMLDGWVSTLPPLVAEFLHAGYLAVGTFFVLSGFVLARRYGNTRWDLRSLRNYAAARIARVYPVYLFSLLLILPFMIMDFRPAWIANYVFLLQGWIEKPAVHWNTPAWSLSCEIFFYALFPVVLRIARTRTWPGVLAVAGGACFLTAIFRAFWMPEDWKPLLHFSDFLIGIAAADAYGLLMDGGRRRFNGQWLYIPAAMLGTALILAPDVLGRHLTLNGVLRPLNALLIIGFALNGGIFAKIFSYSRIVLLGQASYSLYILHVPLLWWWKFADPVNPLGRTPSAALYSVAAVAVSVVVYTRLEEPGNRRLRAMLSSTGK